MKKRDRVSWRTCGTRPSQTEEEGWREREREREKERKSEGEREDRGLEMHTRSGCMRIPRGTRIRPKHMRDLPKLSSLEIYQR